jgi:hypothetical protein
MMQFITGRFVSASVGVVAKLGIADLLANGPKTATYLAEHADVNADALYRVMRMLSMVGVFAETDPKTFVLTPIGDTLRSNVPGSMLGMALWITSPTNYDCWGELMYSVKTGQPAANKVLGVDNVFEYFFVKKLEVGEVFNNGMTTFATEAHSTAVEAYDFSVFKKVVDVGGGHGALMSAILRVNPNLHGVVYDLPQVIAGTHKLLAERGVADRCEAVGGDFFESVPAGADAYVSSVVIHDWDDERAVKILSNMRQAMAPGGKVLTIDAVIPPGNDPYPGKVIDLEMLVMTPGGRERTANEFAALYARAGLKLTRIIPTQSYTCVIEGVAA